MKLSFSRKAPIPSSRRLLLQSFPFYTGSCPSSAIRHVTPTLGTEVYRRSYVVICTTDIKKVTSPGRWLSISFAFPCTCTAGMLSVNNSQLQPYHAIWSNHISSAASHEIQWLKLSCPLQDPINFLLHYKVTGMCAAPCIADTALEGSITNHSTKLTLLFVSDLHQDHKSVTDSQSQESFKIASIFTAKINLPYLSHYQHYSQLCAVRDWSHWLCTELAEILPKLLHTVGVNNENQFSFKLLIILNL